MNNSEIEPILRIVSAATGGVSLDEIEAQLEPKPPRRSLQRWLAELVEDRRIRVKGAARSTRYFPTPLTVVSAIEKQPVVPPVSAANPPPGMRTTPVAPVSPRAESNATSTTSTAPKTPELAANSTRPVARTKVLQAAFEKRLTFAIPDAVRRHVTVRSYESFFRQVAKDYFEELSDADRASFVAIAMTEYRNLSDVTRVKYGIGPATFAYWQAEAGFAPAKP